MPNLTTTIEDYSPLLVYSGSDWTAGTSENDTSLDQYSQSSYMRTNVDGATVFFVFYGINVQIYGAYRSTHGFYQIGIDTKLYPPINGQTTPDSFQKTLFATVALQNGAHTVKMTNEGKTFTDLDFITFQSTVGLDSESMIINTFQDSDSSFSYYPSSSWSTNPSYLGMFSGGNGHVSSSAGSYVTYTFQGDAVLLYGPVGPNGAPYSAQMDNGVSSNYTTSTSTYRPQTLIYYGSNLGAGSHTLKITVQPFNSSYPLTLAVDYAEVFTTASIQRASGYSTSTSSKLSKGAIAGISVGSVFGLFFILAVIVYFVRRWRTGRQSSSIIGHNQEKKAADIIQPFTYNPLPVGDSPSPLLSHSQSHSQLGHETLRTQVSIGSLPTTPPTTGIWPTTAGTVAGAANNADSSDVTSSRNSETAQELIVPQLRSKYRPDLAPQLLSPPPARTRRTGGGGGGRAGPSIPELQITEEVDAGPVLAEGAVSAGVAGADSGTTAPPEYSQDPTAR